MSSDLGRFFARTLGRLKGAQPPPATPPRPKQAQSPRRLVQFPAPGTTVIARTLRYIRNRAARPWSITGQYGHTIGWTKSTPAQRRAKRRPAARRAAASRRRNRP